MAQLGYVGLAMDWNSRAADSSKLEMPIEHYMTNKFSEQTLSDTQASIAFLTGQKFVKGKTVGAVGFCGGGYMVLMIAARSADLAAVVNFYGPPVFYAPRVSTTDPKPNLIDAVDKIKIPIQCHYGTADRIIPNADVERFQNLLDSAKVKNDLYVYENAGHAFYDYKRPDAFHPAGAKLAYERMKAFLQLHIK
jgi:carboxymethylenebutenolidase